MIQQGCGIRALGWVVLSLSLVTIFSCGSSSKKQRLVQRDHLVASKKFYCEFVNGEKYTDIDVALNIFMAEKCDGNRPFSITGYRSVSDIPGVMFCCNIAAATTTPAVLDLSQKSSSSGRSDSARGEGKSSSGGGITSVKEGDGKSSSSQSPESSDSKEASDKP